MEHQNTSCQRTDDVVLDDLNCRLTASSEVDATHVRTSVKDGFVTLEGNVDNRFEKHRAEDIALSVKGVKDVRNLIRVIPWREKFASTH